MEFLMINNKIKLVLVKTKHVFIKIVLLDTTKKVKEGGKFQYAVNLMMCNVVSDVHEKRLRFN